MDKNCIKKIGILRALQLGDLMCSIPAVRALREEFRDAEIFLIGLPNAKGFIQRFPQYFNGLIKFPGFPGFPEQPYDISEIAEFIIYMQKQRFDLILQMQGNGNLINPFIELLGATYNAGFYRPNDYIPQSGFFIEYPEGKHEIIRHLALINHLKIPGKGSHLEFPLTENDYAELRDAGLDFETKSYVCIHPGSRGSWRRWPTANFAALGDYCVSQGKTVVLTGTTDELPIVMETVGYLKNDAVIAAGKTSLGAMGALIKNAFALISNCTGVSHIASALETPGIIISMDGEPERWKPINKDLLYTLDWTIEPHFYKAETALMELFEKHQDKAVDSYTTSH
ncbi:MAG TPA: glycosyltransferase family 9 protein [Lentimicrobium sp.]|nr:glycosyltransferase family 9 protein [Lentimicrobium sp.]